jgi:integrase
VKPSTYLSYQMHVERHINPALGSIPLQQLSGAHLNAFYANLLGQGENDGKRKLSPATVRRIHATLHKALADAVRWNKLSRNPAQAADPPRSKAGGSPEMKTWTAKELRSFLESARATRLYPLWLTLASTGLRRGEALGLRWEDVDVENSRLSIRQNRVSVGHEVIIGKPKTGHGRNVSLDPGTLATLKALRTQQKKERLSWPGYVTSGYVFLRENGEPYHPNLISHAFEAAVKSSQQPRIRLHDLRHTHATLALSAGVHPKVVSERLGHASVMITLDTYSHAIPALQEEAAARVAALFMPF